MKRMFARALLLGPAVAMALWGPALAFCTDPAGPGVQWDRCVYDERSLVGIDLSGASLRSALFRRTDMTDAKLEGAVAYRAKFISAVLVNIDFDKASLGEADFTSADLSGASFRGADLRRTRFFRATLHGADFTGAHLRGADFFSADLSGARWTDGKHICAEGSIGQCR